MTAPAPRTSTYYDGEDLGAAEGLIVAAARLLEPLAEGDTVELTSEHPSVADDMRAWCRRAGHRVAGVSREGSRTRLVVERGFVKRTLSADPEQGVRLPLRAGALRMTDWAAGRNGRVPEEAPEIGALAPRGASVEEGAPGIEFSLRRRSDLWASTVCELYEQAASNQWRGATDIPWTDLRPLDEPLEMSVCQIMTFLAENEYAALYVPARFIGHIHPEFTEVALFLSTVLADEARHIEVFTKRALANGGGLGVASASTQMSLASLFQVSDFSTASFLLSVLGEGTFLDLLAFLEEHAPDRATGEICRRARLDESRHVHFGIAHAKQALAADLAAARRFGSAVEARAEFLKSVSGVGPLVEEALILYAGGGMSPASLRAGTQRVSALYATMHENRVKRLETIGFDVEAAGRISQLHTPNFM